ESLEEALHVADELLETCPDPTVGKRPAFRRWLTCLPLWLFVRKRINGANHKPADIPDLVGEVAVCLHTLHREIHIVAGRGAYQEGEAQGISAKIVHDNQRIDHVAICLRYLAPVLITNQAVQVNRIEGYPAGELQSHHDHARHPEDQNVIASF